MCLFRAATTSFLARAMAAVLSDSTGVGGMHVESFASNGLFSWTSHKIRRSQVICLAHEDMATYSDSADESAMTLCFWLFQLTGPSFTLTMYPVVECRVSVQPPRRHQRAQLAMYPLWNGKCTANRAR